MNIGVILAGGLSSRFGSYVHKQYLKLNGKEVLSYALTRMRECIELNKIILVLDNEEYNSHYIENKYNVETICGGKTRNESIYNAIQYIGKNYECNKILFHDITRPLIKTEYYQSCINELSPPYDCVVSYREITDALWNENTGFVNRDNYKLIQTPEVFYFSKLVNSFDKNKPNQSIVSQLDNPKIKFIKSNEFGFKITYPNDLFLAEQLDKINYYNLSNSNEIKTNIKAKNVLLLGGSGGLGSAIKDTFTKNYPQINVLSPRSYELNLKGLTIEKLSNYCKNLTPDIVINSAAVSYNDSDGLIETFDEIFDVNLKSNLVIIEYLKTLNKKVKFLVVSSSSSTKGRENITNYSASKSALNSVVESQSRILKKDNILLNAIIPEKINTPMIQKLHKTNITPREMLDTNEVVSAIIHILSTDNYGQLIHIRKGL